MKFGSEKTTEWRRWYAWRPVPLEDGRVAWLETVIRRWEWDCRYWSGKEGKASGDAPQPNEMFARWSYRAREDK